MVTKEKLEYFKNRGQVVVSTKDFNAILKICIRERTQTKFCYHPLTDEVFFFPVYVTHFREVPKEWQAKDILRAELWTDWSQHCEILFWHIDNNEEDFRCIQFITNLNIPESIEIKFH